MPWSAASVRGLNVLYDPTGDTMEEMEFTIASPFWFVGIYLHEWAGTMI